MSGGTKFTSEYCPGGHIDGEHPTLQQRNHNYNVLSHTKRSYKKYEN